MKHREALVSYIHSHIDPHFDPDRDQLVQALDSVSLLQLVAFIDEQLGIRLDFGALTLDAFATVDVLLSSLRAWDAKVASAAHAR